MKKKIIVYLLVVIFLLIGVGILFLLPRTDKGNEDSLNNKEEIAMQLLVTDIKSTEEFDTFVDKYKYQFGMVDDKSVASIYDVSFLGENSYATFYFDSNGKTTDLSLFYYLNAVEKNDEFDITELSLEDLADKSRAAIEKFCKMFDCDFSTDLYLANNDGTFTKVESDENFQTIVDRTSYLDFSLRDKNGYYWLLRISYEENLAVVNISKYFNIDEYKDHVANISLYEGE